MTDRISFDEIHDHPWSFDLAELEARIKGGDPLSSVIRGHLYLENILITFIREALPKPELLQLDRLQFATKVEICAALGVLDPATVKPILKLNAIRNKVAHDLHYGISAVEVRDLFHLFEPHHRKILSIEGQEAEVPTLTMMILGLIVLTDFGRKAHLARKKREKEAHESLQEAIEVARQTLSKDRHGS